MKFILPRLEETDKQNLGALIVFDGLEKVFECKTLELAFRDNASNISCIPTGTYELVKRWSPRHKDHLALLHVHDRELILIHVLNYFNQTEGCIGVGKEYKYINSDSELDISSSTQTMTNLMAIVDNKLAANPEEKFFITIL